MRVLHAPVNVGNQPWTLSRAERALGVSSDLIVNYSTWLGYPADRVLGEFSVCSRRDWLRRAWYGFTAPLRHDVLHYYFGRTLLYWDDWPPKFGFPFLDARIAKRMGRKVFFTLQGCDARLAGESNRRNSHTMCHSGGCSAYGTCVSTLDSTRRRFIETVLPLADRVFYLNPELGHYVAGGQFLPYANVDVAAIVPSDRVHNPRPIVLHAPSDPSIKGTKLIEAALERLKGHFDFEFRQVKGVPHTEAIEMYQSADIVIDQVLSGWYGGFAVEAMAMGKPVAVYLRDEDLNFVPEGMRRDLPFLQLHPNSLEADLASAFRRREEWQRIGRSSRSYVMKWHNPSLIARAMVNAYRDPCSNFDLESVVAAYTIEKV